MSSLKTTPEVGAYFAFQSGYHGDWDVYAVTKVTPTGRFQCGPFTCDPDGKIRGSRSMYGPTRAMDVTDEILKSIELRKLKRFFEQINASDLSVDQLKKIRDIINEDAD